MSKIFNFKGFINHLKDTVILELNYAIRLKYYGEVKYILEYLWTEPYSDLRDQHNSSCFSLNVESTVPIEYWAEC